MMKKNNLSCCVLLHFLCCCLLLPALVLSHHIHGNPASNIVDIINKNLTDQKLPRLNDSPGLGCMALQYVELCKGNCTDNNVVNCKPPEDDFTEVFAPNCGVELPTFGTITGHIVGCQRKYLEPSLAFSEVLIKDEKSLSLLKNKSHTEVGVGLVGLHKGPFFWCVLFSNGKTNSTFVLENHGAGIQQKKGCYSGSTTPCSRGQKSRVAFFNIFFMCYVSILLFKLW
ncbi:hypothetical protein AAZX31_07G113800 [Glycine max]|uniref:Ferredoxin-like protein n=2 Tax=Glycine subgen. Soja TaxID=1462606 RepID=K7L132_SOYBN|nr:uncharacterized protein LOC100820431 [Glycine max]XP_028240140.1 uncharacterized protein LOC114418819 [Glycine soja]KAG5009676.1 hypothetical protein JHK87_018191 [Glycine soja]KAG5037490.1 hypothetical protein JHK86_018330 [Glycine max]KAG5142610.1 hypothetical protein JHK82_018305 [Glycine max]KAH1086486.1 hypothetical protein GYH30_018146 [Glycine max]KHN12251.1 hypothetical protein glysoja_035953 [Glycine soja]|eukprot:XP_006583506.1 uncharacterized protein LOC100820431 [Glycine max]